MDKDVLTKTPRLKPGVYTADRVLATVEKLIVAEPKRLKMTTWIALWKGEERSHMLKGKLPSCGTVCCVGGWINTVTGKVREEKSSCGFLLYNYGGDAAIANLGLTAWQGAGHALSELFGQVKWKSRRVLTELAQIRKTYRKELRAAVVEVK